MVLYFKHSLAIPDLSTGSAKFINSGYNITKQMSGGNKKFPVAQNNLSKGHPDRVSNFDTLTGWGWYPDRVVPCQGIVLPYAYTSSGSSWRAFLKSVNPNEIAFRNESAAALTFPDFARNRALK